MSIHHPHTAQTLETVTTPSSNNSNVSNVISKEEAIARQKIFTGPMAICFSKEQIHAIAMELRLQEDTFVKGVNA